MRAKWGAIIVLVALGATAWAQGQGSGSGAGSGSGSDDIFIDERAGSGSGSGSGSAAGSAAQPAPAPQSPPPAPPAPEGPVKDPKLAKKWLQAAQVLVQKGDYFARAKKDADAKAQYENAVTAYERAIEAGDDNSLYVAMALVEDKLGATASAYKHLKIAIDPKSGVKPDVVKKAQAKLDELSAKIGTLMLTITPDGTQVMLAGKTLAESPLTEPLVLDPGTFTLSFVAVGYQPKDVEIKIEAGSESERKIVLEPVKVTSHVVESEPSGEAPAQVGPDKLPLYIGLGATGGLFLVATVTGFDALLQHGTFTDPKVAAVDRKDAQTNGRTLSHISDLCLVGAIGAAAFTTYWYVTKYQPQQRAMEQNHAKLDVLPWVQPDAGGVFAVGSF